MTRHLAVLLREVKPYEQVYAEAPCPRSKVYRVCNIVNPILIREKNMDITGYLTWALAVKNYPCWLVGDSIGISEGSVRGLIRKMNIPVKKGRKNLD
jgi:hypothetical protein